MKHVTQINLFERAVLFAENKDIARDILSGHPKPAMCGHLKTGHIKVT